MFWITTDLYDSCAVSCSLFQQWCHWWMAHSSVVMKYFVNDKFLLLYFLIATKGAACRELYLWYFDFSIRKCRLKARHAVSYMCDILAFPFAVGLWRPGMPWIITVIFRLFRSQTGEVLLWYFDFSYVKDN